MTIPDFRRQTPKIGDNFVLPGFSQVWSMVGSQKRFRGLDTIEGPAISPVLVSQMVRLNVETPMSQKCLFPQISQNLAENIRISWD